AAALCWSLDDVDVGAVVALHVEIAGGESRRSPAVQVAGDRQRFQEYLRHDDSAPDVQRDTTVIECGEGARESPKIAMAGLTDRRAVGGRVLVDDLGADCGVHGEGNVGPR